MLTHFTKLLQYSASDWCGYVSLLHQWRSEKDRILTRVWELDRKCLSRQLHQMAGARWSKDCAHQVCTLFVFFLFLRCQRDTLYTIVVTFSHCVCSFVVNGCNKRIFFYYLTRYDAPPEELDRLFDSINGVLFTGGSLSLETDTLYFKTSWHIFNRAIDAYYNNDDYFPLWGMWLGFSANVHVSPKSGASSPSPLCITII